MFLILVCYPTTYSCFYLFIRVICWEVIRVLLTSYPVSLVSCQSRVCQSLVCWSHVLSISCPVDLVSVSLENCQSRVLSVSCLSVSCPVGLVSCGSRVCRSHVCHSRVLSVSCPVGLVSCGSRVLWVSCPVGLVSCGSRVLSVSCPVGLVSCLSRVPSVSCPVGLVSRRSRVPSVSCPVGLVSRRSCVLAPFKVSADFMAFLSIWRIASCQGNLIYIEEITQCTPGHVDLLVHHRYGTCDGGGKLDVIPVCSHTRRTKARFGVERRRTPFERWTSNMQAPYQLPIEIVAKGKVNPWVGTRVKAGHKENDHHGATCWKKNVIWNTRPRSQLITHDGSGVNSYPYICYPT